MKKEAIQQTHKISERGRTVVIDPDVAEMFPDTKSVNDALRTLAQAKKAPEQISTQELIERLNAVYDGETDEEDLKFLRAMQRKFAKVADEW